MRDARPASAARRHGARGERRNCAGWRVGKKKARRYNTLMRRASFEIAGAVAVSSKKGEVHLVKAERVHHDPAISVDARQLRAVIRP